MTWLNTITITAIISTMTSFIIYNSLTSISSHLAKYYYLGFHFVNMGTKPQRDLATSLPDKWQSHALFPGLSTPEPVLFPHTILSLQHLTIQIFNPNTTLRSHPGRKERFIDCNRGLVNDGFASTRNRKPGRRAPGAERAMKALSMARQTATEDVEEAVVQIQKSRQKVLLGNTQKEQWLKS